QIGNLAEVEAGQRRGPVAFLPVAGLLGAGPGHRLADDIVPAQVHHPQRPEGIDENVKVTTRRRLVKTVDDPLHRAPHDPYGEDTIRRAARTPDGSDE